MNKSLKELSNAIFFASPIPSMWKEDATIIAEKLQKGGYCSAIWVNIKDHLPDPYESVLVWGKNTGGVRWGMYSPNQSIWKDGTISHWMQLPKPPESEDDFQNCKISGCEAARKDCHIGCPHGKENKNENS